MKRPPILVVIFLITVIVAASQRPDPESTAPETAHNPPLAQTESEKRILTTMNEAVRAGELYANVPVADGRMLRLLVEAANAKNVIEIGTSTGISGMWLCMALEKTGGKLTTLELDSHRAVLARVHFKRAGVDHLVAIIEGDAHKDITN